MADVSAILKQDIAQKGSLTVADYMQTCLYHPEYGYYMTETPFGQKGDFTTAPEMTQLFGEALALWVIDTWQKLGSPASFTLLECGPGRGTLMSDMLRTLKKVAPDVYGFCRPMLLEISPHLKALQQKTLNTHMAEWVSSINEINFSDPMIVIGNEFLDAFPIHQHINGTERTITLDGDNLTFSADGDITETSPAIDGWMLNLKQKLNGYALFIDYGYISGNGDSLQALHRHKKVSPFHMPGQTDLTAHVNFGHLQNLMDEDQSQLNDMAPFLMQLGLPLRAAQLLQHATDADRTEIESAVQRLLHPNHMGTLFKAFCYRSSNQPQAIGF